MSPTAGVLTSKQTDEFRALLADRRQDIESQLGHVGGSLQEVRAARTGAEADDEHDPEGPTMSSEWSRLAGTGEALESELRQITAAEARLDAGTYGTCVRCGQRIGVARLRARPEAELCIDCATLVGR